MTDHLEDKLTKAEATVALIKEQKRHKELRELEAQWKKNQSRHLILGEMVTKFFPEVSRFEPSTKAEKNATEFAPFATFLAVLASEQELVARLKHDASRRASADNP